MTVGMLKELIKNVPDDFRVILDNGKCDVDDHNEVISGFTYHRHGKVIQPEVLVLQTKDDIDIKNEIEATIAYYKDTTELTDKEIIAKLTEQGFTADDYRKCCAAVQNMFKYRGVFD